MRRLVLELLAAIALTLAAILALAPAVRASDIMVMGAFARASAVSSATAGTAYLTLINHGAESDRLLSITTEAAAKAELHRSTNEDGIAKMQSVENLDLPAGAAVELKPGGLHVMMTGLKAPLAEGVSFMLCVSHSRRLAKSKSRFRSAPSPPDTITPKVPPAAELRPAAVSALPLPPACASRAAPH